MLLVTYTINVGGFTGDVGDSLTYHNGQYVSPPLTETMMIMVANVQMNSWVHGGKKK